MAGSRTLGPLGHSGEAENLNDGTMIRALSPRPSPIGSRPSSTRGSHRSTSLTPITSGAVYRRRSAATIQVLRQGSRGSEVQKLQRQLNARLAPSPNLAVDGIFGPITLQAVLQYQKGVSISVDGVVGKRTWYYLLKGDKAAVLQPSIRPPQPNTTGPSVRAKSPTPAPGPPASSTQAAGIWEWTLENKFAGVLRRTAPKLPMSMRHEFEALLSPASLGIMAGSLVVWAGSHAFGVGEVVDVVFLAGGALFLGMAVFDVADEVGDFLIVTSTATEERDLDEAASHLARAIAIMGIAAFIALLAKVVKGKGGGKGAATDTPPKPMPERTARQPKPARPLKQPTEPTAPKAAVPRKSPIESQLDGMYAKAPRAQAEINALAEGIAQKTGGKVAKAPLKGRARALEKAIDDYRGDPSEVKDIARNTIVVEQSQYDKAVALLQEQGAKVKSIDSASNPMGYSGANAVVKTKAGIPAEIQVNTPEMIYAKEKPEIARAILGKDKYAELAAKSGVPGGRGHQLYEEYRSLRAGDPRAAELAAESRAYYDHVRASGGQ